MCVFMCGGHLPDHLGLSDRREEGSPSREGRDFLISFLISKNLRDDVAVCGSVLAMIQGFQGTGSYIKAFFIPGWG